MCVLLATYIANRMCVMPCSTNVAEVAWLIALKTSCLLQRLLEGMAVLDLCVCVHLLHIQDQKSTFECSLAWTKHL
jgi:hypothetical protein